MPAADGGTPLPSWEGAVEPGTEGGGPAAVAKSDMEGNGCAPMDAPSRTQTPVPPNTNHSHGYMRLCSNRQSCGSTDIQFHGRVLSTCEEMWHDEFERICMQ
jgi:hypothetical protein